jgi:hypothetical protein
MVDPKQNRQLFINFGDGKPCCGGGCNNEEPPSQDIDSAQVEQAYEGACEELLEEDEEELLEEDE